MIKEDARGQIAVFPYLKLEAQGYGEYIDCSLSDEHPKELYILDSSATSLKNCLERFRLGNDLGLPIRKDRSIIPSTTEYKPITHWPAPEERSYFFALLRAMVIMKMEFSSFNPLTQEVDSHPPGYRQQVRERAQTLLRRSPYLYNGITLAFKVWLDNLGKENVQRILVSLFIFALIYVIESFYNYDFKNADNMTNQLQLLREDTVKNWHKFKSATE